MHEVYPRATVLCYNTHMKIKPRGFTLIELLVVIAIIAILTGIIVTNLASSRSKGNDGKRISDILQIQLALENYFDQCGGYPIPSGTGQLQSGTSLADGQCNSVGKSLSDFISRIPTPPAGSPTPYYEYTTNTTGTDYLLRAKLESNNSALKDSLQEGNASTRGTVYYIMTNWTGSTGTGDFVNISNGNCGGQEGSASVWDYCVGPKL
jgi:prepilin-type N-terminal cleavage/methylation domain-containing protein